MISDETDRVMLAAGIALAVVLNYVIISFVEYAIHRYLMHMKRLPRLVYRWCPYLLEVFEAHAVRHHRRWYKGFAYEPDPIGREENLRIGLFDTAVIIAGTWPIWLVEMWIWPGAAIVYAIMMFCHNRLWGMLHSQMHMPQRVFFEEWSLFKVLARYHFMHHQCVVRNFNVVFPFADAILRGVARPNFADTRAMVRLGLASRRNRRRRVRAGNGGLPLGGSPRCAALSEAEGEL